jgi:hypothetical protein
MTKYFDVHFWRQLLHFDRSWHMKQYDGISGFVSYLCNTCCLTRNRRGKASLSAESHRGEVNGIDVLIWMEWSFID